MAVSIAKAARWLEQVDKARAVVAWVPPQYLPEDERTAYRIQDAFLKKLIPKQGPVVGYKIALTSPQIFEQTGLRGPVYGPIRKKRVFEHKASVRCDRWTRLGVELEIILTVNADVPKPKGTPYDKESIAKYVVDARAGFELIEDRGADYTRLTVNGLVMDVGWNRRLAGRQTQQELAQSRSRQPEGLDRLRRQGSPHRPLRRRAGPLLQLAGLARQQARCPGKTLKKGMIVSSGSMVACQFVPPGSTAVGRIEGLGEVSLKYELPR